MLSNFSQQNKDKGEIAFDQTSAKMKFQLDDHGQQGGEKMPLYEYRCLECLSLFEVLQRLADEPLKKCPKCGGELQKLISRSAIQFKGSGWYITDYARRQPANGQSGHGNGQEKETEIKKESQAQAKSESEK